MHSHFRPAFCLLLLHYMAHTIHQVAVRGFDNNFSYIIADAVTRQAYVVDPNGDFVEVTKQVADHCYTIIGLLLTHTHFDHIDQLALAVGKYHAPIYVYESSVTELAEYEDVRALHDGMKLPLGSGTIEVLHTPGHTDDSVCFYITDEQSEDSVPRVITGDTLFVGGCGRTSEQRVKDLYESLAELAALPNETIVLPGHDYGDNPTSTIGREKMYNKYCLVKNFNEFVKLRLG